MYGQTCIFWANLTPFSLQCDAGLGDPIGITWSANTSAYEMFYDHQAGWGHARVRKMPSWPRKLDQLQPFTADSRRNAWANLHIWANLTPFSQSPDFLRFSQLHDAIANWSASSGSLLLLPK